MHKKIPFLSETMRKFVAEIPVFLNFFGSYSKQKIVKFSVMFENNKNNLVKMFMIKRGRYNRPFLHLATLAALGVVAVIGPFLASTYPVFSSSGSISAELSSSSTEQSIAVGENVFQTDISQKPRDKVIEYTVEKGDTISTIAKKFGISQDTIRWANSLGGDTLSIGDTLKILPVSGISHRVQKGDSVYTIAKKYDTDAQKIVDFPFNDFANPETFSLVEGQMLVVPDGIKPSEQPFIKREVYLAQGPSEVAFSSAGFTWPLQGVVSQFATWYHMAIDIAAPFGSPIFSDKSGRVVSVSTGSWDYGYGNNVVVDNGNGFTSLYAHLRAANVNAGDEVVGGRTIIGWVGLSGRTTGAHLHLEIRQNGTPINPLTYLR